MKLTRIELTGYSVYGLILGSFLFGISYTCSNWRATSLILQRMRKFWFWGLLRKNQFVGYTNRKTYSKSEIGSALVSLAIAGELLEADVLKFDMNQHVGYDVLDCAVDVIEGRHKPVIKNNSMHRLLVPSAHNLFTHAHASEKSAAMLKARRAYVREHRFREIKPEDLSADREAATCTIADYNGFGSSVDTDIATLSKQLELPLSSSPKG